MASRTRGGNIPTLEKRVAYLEGRWADHLAVVSDLRAGDADLRGGLTGFQDQMQRRFELVDRCFEQVDRRFEQVDQRFAQMDHRFDVLNEKIDRHFTWVIGTQVAVLLAIISVLVGSYYR